MTDFSFWNYRVRRYESRDRAACLRIFDSNTPPYFDASERAAYQSYLDRSEDPYWVIVDEAGQALAAGGIAEKAKDTGVLCWGMVEARSHRQGLGSCLLGLRLLMATEHREWTSLLSHTSQLSAAFFARFGFETEAIVPQQFGATLDGHLMRLSLDPISRKAIRARFPSLLPFVASARWLG